MARRFYLPSSGAAPVSPAYGSAWEQTSAATRGPLVTAVTNTAFADFTDTETNSSNTWDVLHRQFISAGFPGPGTISGTISCEVFGRESSTGRDFNPAMVVRVVSNDGSTEVGVLLSTQLAAEWGNSNASRHFNAITVSSLAVSAGDRLVVELGFRATNTDTTSGTDTMRFGDPTANSDLPANTNTSTENRTWVELSVDPFGFPTVLSLGLASETDTALALTAKAGAVASLGLTTETDTALALAAVKTGALVPLGLATETDTALAVTMTETTPITVDLGLTEETDTALGLTVTAGAVVPLGLATETDTALGLALSVAVPLGLATETDTALPVTVSNVLTLALGLATETDTALALTIDASTSIHYPTDTTNLTGGENEEAGGRILWEPPVAPRPPRWVDPTGGFKAFRTVIAQALDVATINPDTGQPEYATPPVFKRENAWRPRYVMGSKDITYWRGGVTVSQVQLVQPLAYGPAGITVHGATVRETPGYGALRFMRDGSPFRIDWVDDETEEVMIRGWYRGVVVGWRLRAGTWELDIGGQVQGRASLRNEQVKLVRGRSKASQQVAKAFRDLRVPFTPAFGGGRENAFGPLLWRSGGTGHLEHLLDIIAQSVDRFGRQWTVMPDPDTGVYSMFRRDRETIHATCYFDDARVVPDLARDLAEEPNRVYAEAISVTGLRIRFAVYPGLKQGDPPPYPEVVSGPIDPRGWGEGTENADLSDNLGVTLLVDRLIIVKRLDLDDRPDGFDAEVTNAVQRIQRKAGLDETGYVNEATWNALYDVDVTGYSHRWAKIEPAAQDIRTQRWFRSATDAVVRRNPLYDPKVLLRDANLQMGPGKTVRQARTWAEQYLYAGAVVEEDSIPILGRTWVGKIKVPGGAVIDGEHTPGTPIGTLRRAVELRPGMNILEPYFDAPYAPGGTLFHITAVDLDPDDGVPELTVDTRGRDYLQVWEVMDRNRETRHSPARVYYDQHRSSTMTKDAVQPWDKVAGLLYQRQHLTANTWNVFPTAGGQEGTVRWIDIEMEEREAIWVMAVFGNRIGPNRLNRLIPDPFLDPDRWADEDVRRQLRNDFNLLEVYGDNDAPCGYWPKNLSRSPEAAITSRYRDDGGFSYFTDRYDALYWAIWPSDNCVIPAGRIAQALMDGNGS